MLSIKNLWKKSILVCGCGRSGTSIMSKLIASHENVEYSFDSPLLHWLFSLISNDKTSSLSKLLEIYLYREVFKGSLNARYLNFNLNDQSNVFSLKDKKEILIRQRIKIDNKILIDKMRHHSLCLKITDATFKLKILSSILKGVSIVGIVRNPYDTIQSINKQKWFSSFKKDPMHLYDTLPFKLYKKNKLIPFWLKKRDLKLWLSANDVEKAAIYYLRSNSALLEYKSNIHIVNYDNFINTPSVYAEKISHILNLRPSKFTKQIINSIKLRSYNKKDLPKNIRSSLVKDISKLYSSIDKIDI